MVLVIGSTKMSTLLALIWTDYANIRACSVISNSIHLKFRSHKFRSNNDRQSYVRSIRFDVQVV